MREYIVPVANTDKTNEGMYIGFIRTRHELIRCKDCKYYKDGDCWHEWDNDGQIYYQSVINEPNPNDYCSKADRTEE